MSLAEERAWLRCVDGYVGSGGSEWAGGETDSDDDFYSLVYLRADRSITTALRPVRRRCDTLTRARPLP